MVWQTILCILAALGIVLLLWLIFGAFVLPMRPRRGRLAWLWQAEGDEAALLRQYEAYAWLRETGLAPTQLVLWDAGLDPDALRLAQYWADSDPRVTLVEGNIPINNAL